MVKGAIKVSLEPRVLSAQDNPHAKVAHSVLDPFIFKAGLHVCLILIDFWLNVLLFTFPAHKYNLPQILNALAYSLYQIAIPLLFPNKRLFELASVYPFTEIKILHISVEIFTYKRSVCLWWGQ